MIDAILLGSQGLNFPKPIAAGVGHNCSLLYGSRSEVVKLDIMVVTLTIWGRIGS